MLVGEGLRFCGYASKDATSFVQCC
jgi:hypothetical protein